MCRKKWPRRASFTSSGEEAPGKEGNLSGGRPKASLLAVQTLWGVAVDRNWDQWSLLAFLIAVK